MQSHTESAEQLNRYVRQTLESRIKPIEVLLSPICDCYRGEPLAYRATVRINSILSGVLDPEDYLRGEAEESLMAEFMHTALKKVISAAEELEAAQKKAEVLFVACPSSFLSDENLYASLSEQAVSQRPSGAKICLEFDREVTELSGERLATAFSDIRCAGFAVAVSGYGAEGFAIEKLLSACPDYVFFDAETAVLAKDREKRSALPPLINLVRGLGGEAIACGIASDEELREFRSRDCFGFIPSETYKGALLTDNRKKTILEVTHTEA